MKKNKAVIIDCYSRGNYHEVINQGYLMMISILYEQVTYIADCFLVYFIRKMDVNSFNTNQASIKIGNEVIIFVSISSSVTNKFQILLNISKCTHPFHKILFILRTNITSIIIFKID